MYGGNNMINIKQTHNKHNFKFVRGPSPERCCRHLYYFIITCNVSCMISVWKWCPAAIHQGPTSSAWRLWCHRALPTNLSQLQWWFWPLVCCSLLGSKISGKMGSTNVDYTDWLHLKLFMDIQPQINYLQSGAISSSGGSDPADPLAHEKYADTDRFGFTLSRLCLRLPLPSAWIAFTASKAHNRSWADLSWTSHATDRNHCCSYLK